MGVGGCCKLTATISRRRSILNAIPSEFDIDFLVIAGGGGGTLGGGGAGGYRSSVTGELSGRNSAPESQLQVSIGQSFVVTIGAGGPNNSAGVNSTFDSIVSNGGGRGGSDSGSDNGGPGGSGGGGGNNRPGGSGTANQGFNGGSGANNNRGGGGGAGQAGNTSKGGDGLPSSITGTSVMRGGGGGKHAGSLTAGAGGGGQGGGSSPQPGQVNTGGGGGGSFSPAGQPGGSGIVILKYPSAYQLTIPVGLTSSTVSSGDFKITSFTAGTGSVVVGI